MSILNEDHLHMVDAATLEQTMAETIVEYEVALGNNGTFLAHGTRDGLPITIFGNPEGEFSAVYFAEE